MSKDKKIEIHLADSQVKVGQKTVDGFRLTIGKKTIGEIAELDHQFAVIKNQTVDTFYKTLENAVHYLIENYNLSK